MKLEKSLWEMYFKVVKDKFLLDKRQERRNCHGMSRQKPLIKYASGMRSITLADQLIRIGDEEVIVAGGMESMSNAPYILPDARWGYRMGDKKVIDMMVHDGLTCSFQGVHMGTYGSNTADEFEITREDQDNWSYQSHQLAISATKSGKFKEEIVAVDVPKRKGDSV